MALTRVTKESIKTTLTLKGQGEVLTFNITYYNRRQSEVEVQLKKEGEDNTVADLILFMVKEWDAEYPLTKEGVIELEDERPGIVYGIIEGFHEARKMHREKN
jgi:hypothetical protein